MGQTADGIFAESPEHDPKDPNPWLALYLDNSVPIAETAKRALLLNGSSWSRQFLLPIIRPLSCLAIAVFKLLKTVIPRRFTSSSILHKTIYWGLKTFVRPEGNILILRHFHIGSELLEFVATNLPYVNIKLNPLKPKNLWDLREDLFLKHDLNIYNFIINLNGELKRLEREIEPSGNLNFSSISDDIVVDVPKRTILNFLDVESAIEVYTPLYQLLLTDSDFWRACNSLQLDETIGIYVTKLIGDSSYLGLVNNRHPLVPMSTLRAGYRLMLHGLAVECLHARLVQLKKKQGKVEALQDSN
jgi:hypothetical protein